GVGDGRRIAHAHPSRDARRGELNQVVRRPIRQRRPHDDRRCVGTTRLLDQHRQDRRADAVAQLAHHQADVGHRERRPERVGALAQSNCGASAERPVDSDTIAIIENQCGHHRCPVRALQSRTTKHGTARQDLIRCRPTERAPVPMRSRGRLSMLFAQRLRMCARAGSCALVALGAACGNAHDPSRDHTLVVALAAEPTLLLPPLIAETPGFVVADQILERLAEPDSTLDIAGDRAFHPRLADRWAWAPDSLSIAFHIAPNARWHDGRPVTAHDVRFTFAIYTDTAVASPAASLLTNIDSVEVRDDRVAVFWFRRRHAHQFFDATYHMRILPKHVLGAAPPGSLRSSAFARAPTGSGPFRFARWVPGQFVELAANDAFREGRARFDRIVFTIATDPSAALARTIAGDIDIMPDLAAADASLAARATSLRLVRWPSLSSGLVMLDLHDPVHRDRPHPVLDDPSVRQALAMAIDRAGLTAAALGDGAEPAKGPLPAALLPDTSQLLPPFDPDAAAALL